MIDAGAETVDATVVVNGIDPVEWQALEEKAAVTAGLQDSLARLHEELEATRSRHSKELRDKISEQRRIVVEEYKSREQTLTSQQATTPLTC